MDGMPLCWGEYGTDITGDKGYIVIHPPAIVTTGLMGPSPIFPSPCQHETLLCPQNTQLMAKQNCSPQQKNTCDDIGHKCFATKGVDQPGLEPGTFRL